MAAFEHYIKPFGGSILGFGAVTSPSELITENSSNKEEGLSYKSRFTYSSWINVINEMQKMTIEGWVGESYAYKKRPLLVIALEFSLP